VVSEERSEVATVVEGKIVTWQDPQALIGYLSKIFGGPEIRMPGLKGFFKGIFVENWRTKLSALALVTIAWLVLVSQQEAELTMTTPVQHTNVAPDLMLGPGSTPTVDLTVSGRRNTIRDLTEQDVQVSIDLSGVTLGRHLIKVSAKNIFLPFGVKIDRVAPQKIMVNLRRRPGDSEPGPDQPSSGF
jgi:hypothetical protein